MWEYRNTDELYHYGVIGMKWGIRRGKTAKAYAKASKKLDKLDAKIQKRTRKLHKAADKADKNRFFGRDYYEDKAKRASAKLAKATVKGKKWVDKMDKAFMNTEISLTQEQRTRQNRYTDYITNRHTAHY